MTRRSLAQLGPLQKAILEAVWKREEATVQQISDALRPRKLAYTTVLSAMQKLEKLGWLIHREEGRAYVYRATSTRADEESRSLRQFVTRVFGGHALSAFQSLLADERLTPDELAELRRLVERRRKERADE